MSGDLLVQLGVGGIFAIMVLDKAKALIAARNGRAGETEQGTRIEVSLGRMIEKMDRLIEETQRNGRLLEKIVSNGRRGNGQA